MRHDHLNENTPIAGCNMSCLDLHKKQRVSVLFYPAMDRLMNEEICQALVSTFDTHPKQAQKCVKTGAKALREATLVPRVIVLD